MEEESNSEFQQQRQATIAEALTSKAKTFGGGQKSLASDADIARIVEMGFSPEQASSALRQSGGKVDEAITALLSGSVGSRDRNGFRHEGGRGFGPPDRGAQRGGEDRENSRRGGRGELCASFILDNLLELKVYGRTVLSVESV